MRWLDRSLVVSPYHIGLCLDEKKFNKEMKRLNVPKPHPEFLRQDETACVQYFTGENGKRIALVCVGDLSNCVIEYVYATLTHEAVHVWQEIKEFIGEDNPGREFEAYSIEAIAYNLMTSYREQTDDRSKN
jgi:hypothetical protein